MTDTTSAAPSDAVLQPDDSEFEQWYATMFKPAMERSPFDKYVARQAWYAAWNSRAPQPVVREPLTHDEALDAFCHTPGIHQFVQAFVAGVRFAEHHHGIKGGQHDAE